MLLVYNGAHPEVVVDELSQDVVIKAGEPTEIPDDLAARLLDQDTWTQAGGETPEQKAAREKAEADKAQAEADAAKAAQELAAANAETPATTEGSN